MIEQSQVYNVDYAMIEQALKITKYVGPCLKIRSNEMRVH